MHLLWTFGYGGEYNNNNKVKRNTILRANKWYNGNGQENVDYVPITVYDPSLIFKWINDQRRTSGQDGRQITFKSVEKNSIPGLYVDSRNIHVPTKEPVFIQREQPSIFISSVRITEVSYPQCLLGLSLITPVSQSKAE